jgi:hypothetical protein
MRAAEPAAAWRPRRLQARDTATTRCRRRRRALPVLLVLARVGVTVFSVVDARVLLLRTERVSTRGERKTRDRAASCAAAADAPPTSLLPKRRRPL